MIMPRKNKLTARQQAFCREYALCNNASEAARRAGFSTKTADRLAYQLLEKPWVLEEVKRLRDKAEDAAICSIREVDTILSEIIRYDHSDYEEMLPDGEVVSVYDKTKPNRRAVRGLYRKLILGGEGQSDVRIAGIEAWDKPKAIDLFYKRHRVYAPEQPGGSGGMTVVFNVTASPTREKRAIDVPSEVVESPRTKKTFALAIGAARKANA